MMIECPICSAGIRDHVIRNGHRHYVFACNSEWWVDKYGFPKNYSPCADIVKTCLEQRDQIEELKLKLYLAENKIETIAAICEKAANAAGEKGEG